MKIAKSGKVRMNKWISENRAYKLTPEEDRVRADRMVKIMAHLKKWLPSPADLAEYVLSYNAR